MMKRPSQKEIEYWQGYLRQRLSAELSMRANLSALFDEAITRLVAIAHKYNVPPSQFSFNFSRPMQREVNAVIDWLRWSIEELTETLAVADHDDRDSIIAYYCREQYGKTFQTRVGEYTARFRVEVELAIAAGLFLGWPKSKIEDWIKTHKNNLLTNELIAEATSEGSDALTRLNVRTSYGRGRTIASTKALTDLTEYAVAEGWRKDQWNEFIKREVYGYWCYRGSSYPCSQCDDECSYFHAEHFDKLPPFHGHCKCYAVPIYLHEIL